MRAYVEFPCMANMKKQQIGDTSKAFHEFQGIVKRLLAVPKSELDEKLREEKAKKARRRSLPR
jgi:hypothetical protein